MGKKNKRSGKRPHYRGKPLWQLLENLPNNGVGRLIVRGSFAKDEKQPSYMRILTVDMTTIKKKKSKKKSAKPENPDKRKINVTVEKVWRGVTFPRPCNIQSTSYLSDFILIPEAEEEKFVRNTKTASECNYVYWTTGQRKRINKRIDEGMSPEEAKQRERELMASEEAEEGSTSQGYFNQNQSNFVDNFDDDDDDDDDNDFDEEDESQNQNYTKVQKRSAEHGPSRSLKRSWPQKSNEVGAKLRKTMN